MYNINILGTDYKVLVKGYKEDKVFKRRNIFGYCDGYAKEIVVCNPDTFPGMKNDGFESNNAFFQCSLRHEIVHAFMFESGLAQNTGRSDGWAINEEMIDWIARQGPKLHVAWKEAESAVLWKEKEK